MVDWSRVEELREKGVGWDKIAADPKVGFHPEASAGDPGRALRALYHVNRNRARSSGKGRSGGTGVPDVKDAERRWSPTRIFYLLVPAVGVWFLLAYLVPSPIGLVVPAFPYLGLILAAVALVLVWLLWRSTGGPRWSKVYRTTVIGGVVVGLVVAGLIGLTGSLAFGCPLLPPSSSLSGVSSSGWSKVATSAWQEGGHPVVYSYGATWCPYCSASSWAEWKALNGFGTTSGTYLDYSSATDSFPQTPEIVLANIVMGSRNGYAPDLSLQVSEDTSGTQNTYPGTASCTQQAYITAYATGIPFVAVNGQYVHDGTLENPQNLANYAAGQHGGAAAVQAAVASENTSSGSPWLTIQDQTYWIMAMIIVSAGQQGIVSTLANNYGWTPAMKTGVQTDVSLIS